MLIPIFENIPDELKNGTLARQWVNWKSVPRKEGGKPTKPPFMPSGKLARTDDPSTWSHFLTAKSAASNFDGIGFVLTKDDPFVAFDFDKCRCPVIQKINPSLSNLDAILPEIRPHILNINSYTEASTSGQGIRIFTKGKLPVEGKRKGSIEVYQSGRYVTLTGHHIAADSPGPSNPDRLRLMLFTRPFSDPRRSPRSRRKRPGRMTVHSIGKDSVRRLSRASTARRSSVYGKAISPLIPHRARPTLLYAHISPSGWPVMQRRWMQPSGNPAYIAKNGMRSTEATAMAKPRSKKLLTVARRFMGRTGSHRREKRRQPPRNGPNQSLSIIILTFLNSRLRRSRVSVV